MTRTMLAVAFLMMSGIKPDLQAQTVVWADGFESPALSGHAVGFDGAFTFGAWSGQAPTTGGNAGVVRGSDNGLAPAEGAQMFAFNGNNPPAGGYVEQSITLVPGIDYVLSYALGRGGQPGQLLNVKAEIDASVSGGTVINADLQSPPQANEFATFTLGFSAPASGTVWIRFTDLSGPNQVSDLWLDGVSVATLDDRELAAIPEPEWGVMGEGLWVIGWAWAAKRRGRIDRKIGSGK